MNKFRLITLLLLGINIFLISCSDEPNSANEVIKRSRLQINLPSPTQGPGELLNAVSVLDLFRLSVLPSDGNGQIHERQISHTDLEFIIDVEVPVGPVEFEAEIISNNGTQIYSGTASTDVQEDNFEVQIQMEAVDGILAVAPDTLVVDDSGTFWVFNKGTRAIEWEITEVDPAPICFEGEQSFECLIFRIEGGKVAPGDSIGVFTRSFDDRGTIYNVLISSNVGQVQFDIQTESGQ